LAAGVASADAARRRRAAAAAAMAAGATVCVATGLGGREWPVGKGEHPAAVAPRSLGGSHPRARGRRGGQGGQGGGQWGQGGGKGGQGGGGRGASVMAVAPSAAAAPPLSEVVATKVVSVGVG